MRRSDHATPANRPPPRVINTPAATRIIEITSADIYIPSIVPYHWLPMPSNLNTADLRERSALHLWRTTLRRKPYGDYPYSGFTCNSRVRSLKEPSTPMVIVVFTPL